MTFTQMLPGLAIVGVSLHLALQAILPSPPPPAPIVVHSLGFENGRVVQSRTVTPPDGRPAIPMTWVAEIMDPETGLDVPGCHGSGGNVYQAGTADATYSLTDWTGNPDCTLAALEPGKAYVLQAAWFSGTETVMAQSAPIVLRMQ